MSIVQRFAVLLATLLTLSVGVLTPYAYGWWSATARATATATATTVPAPTLNCGALSVLTTTFTWTAVSGATSYTLYYANGSSSWTGTATTYSVPNLAAANTAWVVANVNYGSVTWTSASSNTRSYYVVILGVCA